jgi:hypothetical protein
MARHHTASPPGPAFHPVGTLTRVCITAWYLLCLTVILTLIAIRPVPVSDVPVWHRLGNQPLWQEQLDYRAAYWHSEIA